MFLKCIMETRNNHLLYAFSENQFILYTVLVNVLALNISSVV